ncbi:hypothetical protein HZS_5152 [Henneguya salminicola]|nr:hypothetical protein HZS_5152 [Henneguya salminicola]
MVHRNYKVALTHFSKSLTSSQNLNAVGLKQTVVRSILLSKLLIGEYPDRKLFLNECYFKGILPYFDLIKAVKLGSHLLFTQYIDKNQDCYIRDHTAAIVLRLHHNVLKAALVRLSLSYSSIYLTDIAKKLSLDNNDVEFIVAKAIKDNIVNALIDHDLSIANFKTEDNVYNTHKPQKLLQSRSTECYNLYSKFMTSMTYPKSAYTFDAKLECNFKD